MSEIRVGIAGAGGRMGAALIRGVSATAGCRLVAACERSGHPAVGRDVGDLAGLGPLGVAVSDSAEGIFRSAEVVIDFTAPEATAAHAGFATRHGVALVVGTTGLSAAHEAALDEASRKIAMVRAANFSIGVNLLLLLSERVGATLGPDYDVEIVEMHHRHKKDAPSGTALALGAAVAAGRKVPLDEVAVRGRDGITGERKPGSIGFAALRGGDVVGDHTVIFAAEGERLELTHKASHRRVFAAGAVRAAAWVKGRPPGLYSMRDVIASSAGA
jgi:4-hydroxy-tetrahydrodipicolinate reductase